MDATADDRFDLQRFVDAQQGVYEQALGELRAGRKTTHWIWFILPQLAVLGRSEMARRYGLDSLEEAAAYWHHPLLGPRLEACMRALNAHAGAAAEHILGPVDAMKLRSCATLFAEVVGRGSVFADALDIFFAGRPDEVTLERVGRGGGSAPRESFRA